MSSVERRKEDEDVFKRVHFVFLSCRTGESKEKFDLRVKNELERGHNRLPIKQKLVLNHGLNRVKVLVSGRENDPCFTFTQTAQQQFADFVQRIGWTVAKNGVTGELLIRDKTNSGHLGVVIIDEKK